MSSRRKVFFASGGGFTGNGCVFEVTSPGTEVWGTRASFFSSPPPPLTPPAAGNIKQRRRRGQVIIPKIVVHQLLVPPPCARPGIERHQRVPVQAVSNPIRAIKVGGRRAQRRVHNPALHIDCEESPHIGPRSILPATSGPCLRSRLPRPRDRVKGP